MVRHVEFVMKKTCTEFILETLDGEVGDLTAITRLTKKLIINIKNTAK